MSEQELPATLTTFTELMDQRFVIPGTNIRFGVDSVIGLIPGAGDWIGGLASLYLPVYAAMRDVSAPVIFRMFINILIDIGIGSIPVLGDIFDVAWKANTKNARLLDDYWQDPGKTRNRSKWLIWALVAFFVLLIIFLLVALGVLIVRLLEYLF